VDQERKGKALRFARIGESSREWTGTCWFICVARGRQQRQALTLEKNYLHHRYKVSVCILLHVLIFDLLFNHNFLKFIYFIIRKWI
jgi:hypothetical protein